jgi:hypothetical protein
MFNNYKMFKMFKIVAIETAKVTAQVAGVLFVSWITTAIVLDRTLGEAMRERKSEREDRRVREWCLSLFDPPLNDDDWNTIQIII